MFLPRREVIESAAAQTPAAVAAIVLIPAPLAARPARPAESPIVGIMWAWPFRFWFARVSCPGLRFWNRSTWSPLLCTPHVYTYSYLLGTRLTRSLHARARARQLTVALSLRVAAPNICALGIQAPSTQRCPVSARRLGTCLILCCTASETALAWTNLKYSSGRHARACSRLTFLVHIHVLVHRQSRRRIIQRRTAGRQPSAARPDGRQQHAAEADSIASRRSGR